MPSRYVGVDPGTGGGIACLDRDGRVVFAARMPETDRDILELLSVAKDATAAIERVWSSPQQGVKSAFTFGRGYGALRMALTASLIPFEQVLPAKWQGDLGCRTRGDKNVTKARAQEMFPSVKVTHALADALLIAEWLRREVAKREF